MLWFDSHCSHYDSEDRTISTVCSITHTPTRPFHCSQKENTFLETHEHLPAIHKNRKELLKFHNTVIPWQELNRNSRRKLNKKGQYGGLNNFAGGTMEMNPVLPAPFWEVVGSCITINSPHTDSSHFLHHLSGKPHFHILSSLKTILICP